MDGKESRTKVGQAMHGGRYTDWLASGGGKATEEAETGGCSVGCHVGRRSPQSSKEGTQDEIGEHEGLTVAMMIQTVSVQRNIQCKGPGVKRDLAPGSRTKNQL